MTISTTQNQVSYVGDGVTTAFAFNFPFITPTDLKVFVNGSQLSSGAYSVAGIAPVTGSGTYQSGTVTINVAPAAAAAVLIYCDPDQLQSTSLPPNDPFPSKTVEKMVDKLTLLIQRLATKFGNAITFPPGDTTSGVLPAAATRAGTILGFDGFGALSLTAPTAGTATALALALANAASAAQGPSLIALNPPLNYVAGTLGAHVVQDWWNPKDFPWLAKFDGSTNDTAAVQACINAAAAAGVGVYLPPGTSQWLSVSIPANSVIRGAGVGKTTLRQISGANDLMHVADPGAPGSFTSNITITDLTMQGTVTTDGFQPVLHLFFTQGASELTIERCAFLGARGDAIYIGTGNERGQAPTLERHNRNVRIRNCFIDGQGDGTGAGAINSGNKNGRNGVSVIDCQGFYLENTYFTRCSQQTMPGPIDIEPDSSGTPNGVLAIISDINVRGNLLVNNFGQGLINVNLHAAQSSMTVPVRRINILENYCDGGNLTFTVGISLNSTTTIAPTDAPHDIAVRDNFVRNVQNPFLVQGISRVRFEGNWFGETTIGGNITDSANTKTCIDVEFHRNTFYKVAQDNTSGGTAVYCYGTTRLKFTQNLFHTYGKANNTANYAIDFVGAGAQSDIVVEDNTFYVPNANANAWDVRNDGGTLATTSFRHARNKLINVNGVAVVFNNAITPDDWQTPTLLNSWVAFGSNDETPQFAKDATGRVHLRGSIKSGTTTAGTPLFLFPVGFRPGKTLRFSVAVSNAGTWVPGFLDIDSATGNLGVTSLPANTLVSLNGISFKAEV